MFNARNNVINSIAILWKYCYNKNICIILSSKTPDFYYYLTTTHVRNLPRFAEFL